MPRKTVNSQLANFKTYSLYLQNMITLAENVFQFKNMPDYIDMSYVNKQLLRKGSIAFFVDEILGLVALPYVNIGSLDIYGRPRKIQCIANNGYQSKILNSNEFVIMYDNMGKFPIFLNICQFAERIALCTRVCDINIGQQRTPRIFKTPTNKSKSLKDILNNIDSFEETILTYDNIDIEDTEVILSPAPFVADKVSDYKLKVWGEFLQLIGITSLSEAKRERLIKDEVIVQLGGTIASRYNRFTPRQQAVNEINKKFGYQIELEYYDGLPTTLQDNFSIKEEGVFNDI